MSISLFYDYFSLCPAMLTFAVEADFVCGNSFAKKLKSSFSEKC